MYMHESQVLLYCLALFVFKIYVLTCFVCCVFFALSLEISSSSQMETSSQMENSKTNQTLCTSLQSYVSDIHTPQHLYPSEYLTDKMGHTVMKTVAASALRLALKSEGGSSDVHFIIEEMSGDINKWPTIVEWVRKRLVEQIKTAFNGNVDLSCE